MFGSMMSFVARTATVALVFLPVVEAGTRMLFKRAYDNCGQDDPPPLHFMPLGMKRDEQVAKMVNELADRVADMLVIYGAHIAGNLVEAVCEVIDELHIKCHAKEVPLVRALQKITASEGGKRVSGVRPYNGENHCHAGSRMTLPDSVAKTAHHQGVESKGTVRHVACYDQGNEPVSCNADIDSTRSEPVLPGTLTAIFMRDCASRTSGRCDVEAEYNINS